MNSHGQRDREREWPRQEKGFRLLALGDSFLEAYTVPLEQTVTQQLERSLAGPRCSPEPEVLNAGTAGYSTDQEYLYYRDEGQRYGAQVVLLFAYSNDVLYNVREMNLGLPKPLVRFKGGVARVGNEPVPLAPEPPPPAPPIDVPRATWVSLDLLGDRLERSAPRAYNALANFGLWPPTRPIRPLPEMSAYSAKPDAEMRWAFTMTERLIDALKQETLAHGARLAIVYVPSRLEISDAAWDLTRYRYGLREGQWQRDVVASHFRSIAERLDLPFLDPTPALSAEEGLFRTAYLPLDGHWNARGHAVAAQQTEALLRGLGWAPSCAS